VQAEANAASPISISIRSLRMGFSLRWVNSCRETIYHRHLAHANEQLTAKLALCGASGAVPCTA